MDFISFINRIPSKITKTSTNKTAISSLIPTSDERLKEMTSTPPVDAPRENAIDRASALKIPPITLAISGSDAGGGIFKKRYEKNGKSTENRAVFKRNARPKSRLPKRKHTRLKTTIHILSPSGKMKFKMIESPERPPTTRQCGIIKSALASAKTSADTAIKSGERIFKKLKFFITLFFPKKADFI
jgi:hypothetical protein